MSGCAQALSGAVSDHTSSLYVMSEEEQKIANMIIAFFALHQYFFSMRIPILQFGQQSFKSLINPESTSYITSE